MTSNVLYDFLPFTKFLCQIGQRAEILKDSYPNALSSRFSLLLMQAYVQLVSMVLVRGEVAAFAIRLGRGKTATKTSTSARQMRQIIARR